MTEKAGEEIADGNDGDLAEGDRRNGHILLLNYEFGPHNHTGGYRWERLIHHLCKVGWTFDVIARETPRSAEYESERVRLHAVSNNSPVTHFRALLATRSKRRSPKQPAQEKISSQTGSTVGRLAPLRARANEFADLAEQRLWSKRALALGARLCNDRRPDVIIATSPVVETHNVAVALKKRFNIPYLADFRDPWYYGRRDDRAAIDKLTLAMWKREEKACATYADAMVDIALGAQEAAAKELAEQDIVTGPRFFVPSGYEPRPVQPVDRNRFRILYSGWLWPFMPLEELFRAIARFRRKLSDDERELLEIELIGVSPLHNGRPIEALAADYDLEDVLHIVGRVPRARADDFQERAAVLVAFDSVVSRGLCVPSKLYAYAPCRGAILPIGDPGGAMAREAARIEVPTIAANDTDGIVTRLGEAWHRWKSDNFLSTNDPGGTLQFSHRAAEMDAILSTMAMAARRRDEGTQ